MSHGQPPGLLDALIVAIITGLIAIAAVAVFNGMLQISSPTPDSIISGPVFLERHARLLVLAIGGGLSVVIGAILLLDQSVQ